MKYTIDTVNKTIEIENGTVEEVAELCKINDGYTIISKTTTYPYVPYYPTYPTYPIQPFYYTTNDERYSIDCDYAFTGGSTTDLNSN